MPGEGDFSYNKMIQIKKDTIHNVNDAFYISVSILQRPSC